MNSAQVLPQLQPLGMLGGLLAATAAWDCSLRAPVYVPGLSGWSRAPRSISAGSVSNGAACKREGPERRVGQGPACNGVAQLGLFNHRLSTLLSQW